MELKTNSASPSGRQLLFLALVLIACGDDDIPSQQLTPIGVKNPGTGGGAGRAGTGGGAGRAGTGGVANPEPTGEQSVHVNLSSTEAAALQPQYQSEWCWAATIANVFAYHGHPVNQIRIVAEAYGVVANVKSGPYAQIARLLNRVWVDDNGHPFTSQVVGALDLMAGVSTLDNDALRDALADNEPVVIATTTHAMLMIGMTFISVNGHIREVERVDVFDPWPMKGGFRALTVSEATPAYQDGGMLMFVARVQVSSPAGQPATPPQHLPPTDLPNPMLRPGGHPCGDHVQGHLCSTNSMGDTMPNDYCASGRAVVVGSLDTPPCATGEKALLLQCACEASGYDCKDQIWGEGACPGSKCAVSTFTCSGNTTTCGNHSFYVPIGWDSYCCESANFPVEQFVPCAPGSVPCFAIGTCMPSGETCPDVGISCVRELI